MLKCGVRIVYKRMYQFIFAQNLIMVTITVIVVFIVGIFLGRMIKASDKFREWLERLVTYSVWILLFLMGIAVGINKTIIQNFEQIGYLAFFLTIGAVVGSVLLSAIVYRYLFRAKKLKGGEEYEG